MNTPLFLGTEPYKELAHKGLELGINLGLKILAAIAIYIVGGWLIKKIKRLFAKFLAKRKVEASLSTFLQSALAIILLIVLIVSTIHALGIDTTSLVALIGGAGLAIGMAFSGTLQNFAGGVLLLVLKPFKVGDLIEAQNQKGTVSAIEIAHTHLITPDNRKIIIPNGALFNGTIINLSQQGQLRCEWNISIAYGDNSEIARAEIVRIIEQNTLILKGKEAPEQPYAIVSDLAQSCVVITGRGWCKSEEYFTAMAAIREAIYIELPKKGIHFPFPQMDVHIKQSNQS